MTLAAGTTLQNDRYVIQAVLNQSDFGVTYAAVHAETDQAVLVQTLNDVVRQRSDFADLQQQFLLGLDRFLQEQFTESDERFESPHQQPGKVLDCFQENDLPFVVWQISQQPDSLQNSFKVSDWLQLPVEITETHLMSESGDASTSELTRTQINELINESVKESFGNSEVTQSEHQIEHQTVLPVNASITTSEFTAIATPASTSATFPLIPTSLDIKQPEFANVDLFAQLTEATADEPVTQAPFTGFAETDPPSLLIHDLNAGSQQVDAEVDRHLQVAAVPRSTEDLTTENPTVAPVDEQTASDVQSSWATQNGNGLNYDQSAIATQVAVRRTAPLPAIVRPKPERLFPIALSITSVVAGFLATGFVLSVRLAPERSTQSATDGQPALSSNFLFNRDQSFSAKEDWPITDTSSVFPPSPEPALQDPVYRTVTPIDGTQPNGTAGDASLQNSAIQQPTSPNDPAANYNYNYGLEAVPSDRSLPRTSSPRLAPAPRPPVQAPQTRIADPAPLLEELQPSNAQPAAPEPEPSSPPAVDSGPAIANPAITAEPEVAPPEPPPAPEEPTTSQSDAVNQ